MDEMWAAALFSKHGPFDVLINNAGIMELGTIEDYTKHQFMESLEVNLLAPFVFTQQFVRVSLAQMRTFKRPGRFPKRIINTTSMAVKTAATRCPGYMASKAGLEAMTRGFAKELGVAFICCCIAPNCVEDTDMMEQGFKHLVEKRGFSVQEAIRYMTPPIGRQIQHVELCKVFRFAVEEMPVAMTGTTLYVPAGCGA